VGGTAEECATDCDALLPECEDVWQPYLECLAVGASYSCDADGNLTSEGCRATGQPYQACVACAPVEGETACDICLRSNCCSALQDYYGAADVYDFSDCSNPCADQGCLDDCAAEFPTAGAAYDAAIGCGETSCADDCI
jgi:hypothetical protein